MIKLFESWGAGKGSFAENGQFLALFFVALLLLWLLGEGKHKEFKLVSFVTALLLLCPFTAKILLVFQTTFYKHENVWVLLPLTALLAYGLVRAAAKMLVVLTREDRKWKTTISGKKEKLYEVLVVSMLAVLLFMCGSLSFAEENTERTNRGDGLPEAVGEVLDLVTVHDGDKVTMTAPDEVVKWVRLYNGNIQLPYGRDMVEQELTVYLYDKYTPEVIGLHDWVNGTLPAPTLVEEAYMQEEAYVEQCLAAGYQYLVFTTERANNDLLIAALENCGGYQVFAETDQYVIYSMP